MVWTWGPQSCLEANACWDVGSGDVVSNFRPCLAVHLPVGGGSCENHRIWKAWGQVSHSHLKPVNVARRRVLEF
jgi:hypothetical protein